MKNKEKIEEELVELMESRVKGLVGEDGLTIWDFADLRDTIVALIQEREREAVESIRKEIYRKRQCRSHEPENCNICIGRQEALDIINAYLKGKETK
jgi:hypothetical protein